jgi:hypothetical protein
MKVPGSGPLGPMSYTPPSPTHLPRQGAAVQPGFIVLGPGGADWVGDDDRAEVRIV